MTSSVKTIPWTMNPALLLASEENQPVGTWIKVVATPTGIRLYDAFLWRVLDAEPTETNSAWIVKERYLRETDDMFRSFDEAVGKTDNEVISDFMLLAEVHRAEYPEDYTAILVTPQHPDITDTLIAGDATYTALFMRSTFPETVLTRETLPVCALDSAPMTAIGE